MSFIQLKRACHFFCQNDSIAIAPKRLQPLRQTLRRAPQQKVLITLILSGADCVTQHLKFIKDSFDLIPCQVRPTLCV